MRENEGESGKEEHWWKLIQEEKDEEEEEKRKQRKEKVKKEPEDIESEGTEWIEGRKARREEKEGKSMVDSWKRKEREQKIRKIVEEEERRMRERKRDKEEEANRRRKRNLIWREVEGGDREERMIFIKEIMRRIIGEEVEIIRSDERRGEAGRQVILIEIEGKVERDYILSKRKEIRDTWAIGVDEDLTMEERRMRLMMMEVARRERRKGRKVEGNNRELWVDNRKWSLDRDSNK